ncbi:MAG: hypothetical protein D8M57_08945 [Candidatus Scalindua sp. AMX11]|nr:MAG: hypothetical protein DWQ00_10145 [Candidatus Scalindua sp.]TDE65310.1 MAG: hypothetical protein D8M57_08945 [Candidatus Scalindua sp. AMX11]
MVINVGLTKTNILLFLMTILGLSCVEEPSNEVTLFDEIKVSFNIGDYKLFTGCSGELGEPTEAFLKFYAVQDGRVKKEISSIEEMHGIIGEIKTEQEAIDLIYLFKSPETNYLFEKGVNKSIVLLRRSDGEIDRIGTLSTSRFRELGLRETGVEKQSDGFVVALNLVKTNASSDKREIVKSVETVSRKGRHKVIQQETVAYVEPDEILMPYYE